MENESDEGGWSEFSDIEYNEKGEEVKKSIPRPSFLSDAQSEDARKELDAIEALGTAEEFLSKQTLEWANRDQNDPRVPEALYILTRINEPRPRSNVGNVDVLDEAENLLRGRYPNNPWTIKLDEQPK